MEKDANLPKLHEVPPRENAGRDTIARYQCQFKAAAYECLSLLEGESLDRIYCDYQDDYVTRFNCNGSHVYHFFQVKTKEKLNHQWSTNEILGILKKATKKVDIDKLSDSFLGKLLIHTVNFKNACGKVVFLTNIHFDDNIEAFKKAVLNEEVSNRHYKLLDSTHKCNNSYG